MGISKVIRRNLARVIISSSLRGLAAVARLAGIKSNNTTRKYGKSIQKMVTGSRVNWQTSVKKGKPNFSLAMQNEHNIRKFNLWMNFIDLKRYGHEVNKRIYDSYGDMDQYNLILNMAGKELRNEASIYFPLPPGEKIDDVSGYYDEEFGMIPLAHPNNPSLDFIDMIRAHVQEVCKHLVINRIGRQESKKYIKKVIYDYRDILNWVFAGGRQGVSMDGENHVKSMDRICGKIVNEIRRENIHHLAHRVTEPSNMKREPNTTFIAEQIDEDIKNHQQFLNDKFIKKLHGEFITQKKRKGTLVHNSIAFGLPMPYSLKKIVYEGDKYAVNNSGYLIVAELPLVSQGKTMKADIVIFKKIAFRKKKYWKPIVVLDIKSKGSYDWDYFAEKSKSKNGAKRPKHKLRQRQSTDDEWDSFVNYAMNEEVEEQLSGYRNLISYSYSSLTQDEKPDILEGVISVRSDVDDNMLREEVHCLIDNIIQRIRGEDPEFTQKMFLNNRFIHSVGNNAKLQFKHFTGNLDKLLSLPISFAFKKRSIKTVDRRKKVTLYLHASSQVNFGDTASWIAAHHHLIKFLKKKNKGIITIVDVFNQFDQFKKERLRLDDLSGIDFININYLKDPDLSKLKEIDGPVIISGWSDLKKILGDESYSVEKELIRFIKSKEIYLMDKPMKDVDTSEIYKMRCLLPYGEKNSRNSYITDIMWNLPVPPKRYKKPKYDNIRIILHQRDMEIIDGEIISISPLKGISIKFSQNRTNRYNWGNDKSLNQISSREKRLLFINTRDLLKFIFPVKREIREICSISIKISDFKIKKKLKGLTYCKFSRKKRDVNASFTSRCNFKLPEFDLRNSYKAPMVKSFNISDRGECEDVLLSTLHTLRFKTAKQLDPSYSDLLTKIEEILSSDKDMNNNKKMILKVLNYYEVDYNIVITKLLEYPTISFYNKYVPSISFNTYEYHTLWLRLMLLTIKLLYKNINDNEIQKLFNKYSTWLLYILGYEFNNNNTIFNLDNIWRKLIIDASRFKSTQPLILDIRKGYFVVKGKGSIIYLEDDQEFIGVLPITELKHMAEWVETNLVEINKIKNSGIVEKIPILIGSILGNQYLWKYTDVWEMIGKCSYFFDYSDLISLKKLSIYITNLEYVPDIEPLEYDSSVTDNYLVSHDMEEVNISLEFQSNTRVIMEINYKNSVKMIIYDDLKELIEDLKSGQYRYLDKIIDEVPKKISWDRYTGIRWGELQSLKALVMRGYRMQYQIDNHYPESIMELYDEIKTISKRLSLKIRHRKDWCPLRHFKYNQVKSRIPLSLGGKRDEFNYFFHADCWEVFCDKFDISDFSQIIGRKVYKGLFADEIDYLFTKGQITHKGLDETFKFDIKWVEEDHVIYQEDSYMLRAYRQSTGKFYLKQLDPLSSTIKGENYPLRIDKNSDGGLSLITQSSKDGTNNIKFLGVFGCDNMKETVSILKNLSEQPSTYGIVKGDIEELVKPIQQLVDEHLEECDYHNKDEDTQIYSSIDLEITDDGNYFLLELKDNNYNKTTHKYPDEDLLTDKQTIDVLLGMFEGLENDLISNDEDHWEKTKYILDAISTSIVAGYYKITPGDTDFEYHLCELESFVTDFEDKNLDDEVKEVVDIIKSIKSMVNQDP